MVNQYSLWPYKSVTTVNCHLPFMSRVCRTHVPRGGLLKIFNSLNAIKSLSASSSSERTEAYTREKQETKIVWLYVWEMEVGRKKRQRRIKTTKWSQKTSEKQQRMPKWRPPAKLSLSVPWSSDVLGSQRKRGNTVRVSYDHCANSRGDVHGRGLRITLCCTGSCH